MSAGYQLRITPLGQAPYLFAITPSIDYDLVNHFNTAGSRDGSALTIQVHAMLKTGAPPDGINQVAILLALCEANTPSTVEILFNGGVVQSYAPTGNIGSPYVRNFATVPQGGSLVNMIEFTLDIIMMRQTTKISGQTVTNQKREVEREFYNERQQKQIWKVTATGPGALAVAVNAKPQGLIGPISATTILKLDDNTFEGIFEFDIPQDDKFLRWEETIKIEPGGVPIIEVPRTGDLPPLLEQGRKRAPTITVTGWKTSIDKAVAIPPPLFDLKFRDDPESHDLPARPEDGVKGIWRVDYHHVFRFQTLAGAKVGASRVPVRKENWPQGIVGVQASPAFAS